MKASELHIGNLLEFLPEQGKILLERSRVMILDATSLGMLRKDLINTLGIDRAKGFLIRYGYSCGYQAAMNIKKEFQWDEEGEGVFSGPTMHTQQGFVLSKLFYNINHQTETGFYHGSWTNSYEAEQHILHFGYHHEPVCWNLAGYASGYSSARLGKKIIYKELECVGKGDKICTYVGRTIEDWGEEINSELSFYEMSKINEELEDAHRKIKVQNKILEHTIAIHEQLTQCILNGKGIAYIIAILAELMKSAVVLEDHHLNPLSSNIPQTVALNDSLKPYLFTSTSLTFKEQTSIYLKRKRPFEINDQYSDIAVNRLVSPILVGNQFLGFISLLRLNKRFSNIDHIAIEHAASIIALEILKEKEIAEVENRLKGDFIDDLLSENFSDSNSIIIRARGLDYDISLPHRVLVLFIDNLQQLTKTYRHNEKLIFQFKTDLFNCVKDLLKTLGKGIINSKGEYFIILLQIENHNYSEESVRLFSEKIFKRVSEKFPEVLITIGIGTLCTDLSAFSTSFRSAQKAIEIGKVLKKHDKIVSLEQFGAHSLLFSTFNPEDLYHYAIIQIGSLLEYDKNHKTQFLQTLQNFLNLRDNIEKTARTMNLSVSGLKYRLQRIEEITGQSLKDSENSFNLELALKILQLTGTEKIIG